MVSAVGLAKDNWRTKAIMKFHPGERPIGLQIFGRDPEFMAGAARLAAESRPDLIDINFSCPAPKIVSRGAGAALLREPERMKEIARAVVGAVSIPVTAKIRIGWDRSSVNAVDVARLLEDGGVAAIAVHGRTWEQGFRDRASWHETTKVKRAVGIPVVLSGDVTSPETAARAFDETGCDAVMIGRASFGRPWLFSAIKAHFEGGPYAVPGLEERTRIALRHLDLTIDQFGERIAVRRFRKHLLWYTKGTYGVVRLREHMGKIEKRDDVVGILDGLNSQSPPWGIAHG
jgi:tRNA-dihydrouridine synthase B